MNGKTRRGCALSLSGLGAAGTMAVLCAVAAATAGGGNGGGAERRPRDIVIGRYGSLPGRYETARLSDGTVLGIGSFCVDGGGGVVVLDATGRRVVVYGPEGDRLRDISLPSSREGLRVAAAGGRLYALCLAVGGRARPPRGGPNPARGVGPACGPETGRSGGDLRLISCAAGSERWKECAAVSIVAGGEAHGIYDKLFLVKCGLDIYLCNPVTCTSTKLTGGGGPVEGSRGAVPEHGWRLPSGARAVKCGWGISLLWDDGSRRDMPWLAGSPIGGDLAGRLYICEIDEVGDRTKVSVAAYDGDGLLRARWCLPRRPGEVRMSGPRVIVAENGGLYEFWSARSEFHIARWEIEGELAEGRPH
jgi:hypothetical protein